MKPCGIGPVDKRNDFLMNFSHWCDTGKYRDRIMSRSFGWFNGGVRIASDLQKAIFTAALN
jgi:hypothetical protein